MLEAGTVVGVKRARSMVVVIDVDIEANLVVDTLGKSIAVVVEQDGHDRATLDEDGLLEVRKVPGHGLTSDSLNFLGVVVVPLGSSWQSEGHFLHVLCLKDVSRSLNFGGDKH